MARSPWLPTFVGVMLPLFAMGRVSTVVDLGLLQSLQHDTGDAGYFTLHSVVNGACLSYDPRRGAPADVEVCRMLENTQTWYYGQGNQIRTKVNDYCLTLCTNLDCPKYPMSQMAEVKLAPCAGPSKEEQNWIVNQEEIINEKNGNCLTQCMVCHSSRIVTYPCSKLSSQLWRNLPPFAHVSSIEYRNGAMETTTDNKTSHVDGRGSRAHK